MMVLRTGMQLLQFPKTNTAYPWATLIITISINLACQVSPLEDTLVLTKKDNVPLQTVGHSKRSLLLTPMTQIQHTLQTYETKLCEGQTCQICHITTNHIPKWQVVLDLDDFTHFQLLLFFLD